MKKKILTIVFAALLLCNFNFILQAEDSFTAAYRGIWEEASSWFDGDSPSVEGTISCLILAAIIIPCISRNARERRAAAAREGIGAGIELVETQVSDRTPEEMV